jgi:hypothetical protein
VTLLCGTTVSRNTAHLRVDVGCLIHECGGGKRPLRVGYGGDRWGHTGSGHQRVRTVATTRTLWEGVVREVMRYLVVLMSLYFWAWHDEVAQYRQGGRTIILQAIFGDIAYCSLYEWWMIW